MMTLRVDVISDVVCPWCFIGKRRLSRALEILRSRPEQLADIEVVWHPFQLNPGLPSEGTARADYVKAKFGSRAASIYERVEAAGRTVGIEFAFHRIVRQPNTLAAHQLVALARQQRVQDQMVETLFAGYFLRGCDLTQRATLLELAAEAGIDSRTAAAGLDDDALRQAVIDADEQARASGISGVPFFIVGGQVAISGAQEPEVLARAFQQAEQTV
jgi:predicted DsbA family dithiol-disulfide isomerase